MKRKKLLNQLDDATETCIYSNNNFWKYFKIFELLWREINNNFLFFINLGFPQNLGFWTWTWTRPSSILLYSASTGYCVDNDIRPLMLFTFFDVKKKIEFFPSPAYQSILAMQNKFAMQKNFASETRRCHRHFTSSRDLKRKIASSFKSIIKCRRWNQRFVSNVYFVILNI